MTRKRAPLAVLLVTLLGGIVGPARADFNCSVQPPYGTPEWYRCDLENQVDATGRLQDQYSNLAYHAAFLAKTHQTWHGAIAEQLEDPMRPRLTVGQWAPGGQTGDPFRIDWEKQGRGIQIPISFLNRNGSKLQGHIWAPPHAADGSLPGIVITTGSIQAPESVYWWAAQGLAEAGYMVITYDVTGQGRSETFGHNANGMFTCPPSACPSQNIQNFIDGTLDALDLLTATPAQPYTWEAGRYNPLWRWLDTARLGAAGHSLGASAVTWVQDIANRGSADAESARFLGRGITLPVVDTVVGWDNLASDAGITPRVPAMGQNGEYFVNTMPGVFLNCGFQTICSPSQPDPDNRRKAFLKWKAASVDSMQVALRHATHLEWSFVPYILPASHDGERVAMYYTLAWFDRYLRGETGATARLTASQFDGSADASAIGTGFWDGTKNVPYTISGQDVGDHFSIYFRPSYWLNGGALQCNDMRPVCAP